MMKCEWILCPVCGSKTRNKIRKDTVLEKYFKELLNSSSLPDVTWHSIRKSYTTLLLSNKCPLKAVSKNLGHDKELVTTGSYAKKQMIIWDATEEIENFMSDVMPAAGEEVYFSDFAIDISEYM